MMALRVVSELFGLAWRHPFVSFGILLLFTPPFFPIIRFFSPLLISTAVFIIAMVSLGPSSKHGVSESEDWDLRKPPEVGVREDKVVQEQENGERPSKKRKAGKESWVDWVKNVEAIGLAWVDQKFKNEENWPGQTLDDHNVCILQEAFGRENLTSPQAEITEGYAGVMERGSRPSVSRGETVGMEFPMYDEDPRENSHEPPHVLDSGLPSHRDEMLSEDAEDVAVEEGGGGDEAVARGVNSGVMHDLSSVPVIQIPAKFALVGESSVDSPSTDDLNKRRHKVVGPSSTLSWNSDLDSPATLTSASGKLSGVESLTEAIENHENIHQEPYNAHAAATQGLRILQPSTSEKVNDIIEKLKVFCEDGQDPPPSKQSSPLFKPLPTQDNDNSSKKTKKKLVDSSDDEDTSSGDEVMSDSDSDSGIQIFPAHPTADIKVHPPMKLDNHHLEQQHEASNIGARNESSH